jgi:flagellar basal body-associated protein FliL
MNHFNVKNDVIEKCYKHNIDKLIMNSEINQLKEQIKNQIDREGLSTLLNTLATQANAVLRTNESRELNSLDFAVLKMMMIDYLNNNFNR